MRWASRVKNESRDDASAWRRGVVLTALNVSTKLLYVGMVLAKVRRCFVAGQ